MTRTKNNSLGHWFTDSITGFHGVCVGYASHITGCDQLCLQPRATDGTLPLSHWFDATRLYESAAPPIELPVAADAQGADERVMRAPGLRR